MKANSPIMVYLERNKMIDDFITYGVYMRYTVGLSYFNSAALMVQRRGVGFAASEATWQKRFGREIKPGANPLIVMKPFAPLELYFEACDTYSPDGEKLPEWIAEDNASVPQFPHRSFELNSYSVARMLNNHGIYYDEREMGERAGGTMEYCEAPLWLDVYHNKKYEHIQSHYAMVVNSRKSSEEKAAAIFHEIGHLLCGHLPQDEALKKINWISLSIPKRDTAKLSLEQKEYEAETACMMIMNGLGYDYDRSKYLDDYLIDGQEPVYDLGMSVAAADQFLSWMNAEPELRHSISNLI